MIIYVVCHDDRTENVARDLCDKWSVRFAERAAVAGETLPAGVAASAGRFSPLRIPPTPYMESYAFRCLADKEGEWSGEGEDDYVGMVTYSILAKLTKFMKSEEGRVDIDWFGVRDHAKKKEVDVLGIFGVEFRKSHKDVSVLQGAVFQHGVAFYRAWCALLTTMGFVRGEAEVEDFCTIRYAFMCNWWIAKPGWMKRYIADVFDRVDAIIRASVSVARLVDRDAYYGSGKMDVIELEKCFGKPYYTLRPFLLERLATLYFHTQKAKVGVVHRFVMNLP